MACFGQVAVLQLFIVAGLKHLRQLLAEKRSILLTRLHFLTLELVSNIFRMHNPGIVMYRLMTISLLIN
ncbi:MAG: hypothetical protein ACFC03_01705 [Candidatus Malihini olakiniferum]